MKREFSKTLLIQESILIWIVTTLAFVLAFVCVFVGFTASLPWISAMVGLPWAAYGVSQACYYNKSKAEKTQGGVVYEQVKHSLAQKAAQIDINGPI